MVLVPVGVTVAGAMPARIGRQVQLRQILNAGAGDGWSEDVSHRNGHLLECYWANLRVRRRHLPRWTASEPTMVASNQSLLDPQPGSFTGPVSLSTH